VYITEPNISETFTAITRSPHISTSSDMVVKWLPFFLSSFLLSHVVGTDSRSNPFIQEHHVVAAPQGCSAEPASEPLAGMSLLQTRAGVTGSSEISKTSVNDEATGSRRRRKNGRRRSPPPPTTSNEPKPSPSPAGGGGDRRRSPPPPSDEPKPSPSPVGGGGGGRRRSPTPPSDEPTPSPSPAGGGEALARVENEVGEIKKIVKSIDQKLHFIEDKVDQLGQSAPPPAPSPPPADDGRRRRRSGKGGTPSQVPKSLIDRWANAHNYWRCIHNTGPVTWDPEIAKGAQEWANRGLREHAQTYKLKPPQGPTGENIANGAGVGPEIASAMWHDEVPENGPRCGGHCTAMLWKSANRLGCGLNTEGGGRNNVVCRYGGGQPLNLTLAANFGGLSAAQANVKFPDMSREPECLKKWPPGEGEKHSPKLKSDGMGGGGMRGGEGGMHGGMGGMRGGRGGMRGDMSGMRGGMGGMRGGRGGMRDGMGGMRGGMGGMRGGMGGMRGR